MENNKIPILELRSRFRAELKKDGISDETMRCYKSALNHLIEFMEANHFNEYDEEVGRFFSRSIWKGDVGKGLSTVTRNMLHKVVRVVNYIIGIEKSPSVRPVVRKDYHYAEPFKDVIMDYFKALKDSGRSEGVIASYRHVMSTFSVALDLKGITPSTIKREDVVDFFSTRPDPDHYYSTTVRCVKYFCLYLHKNDYIKDDFASSLGDSNSTINPKGSYRSTLLTKSRK